MYARVSDCIYVGNAAASSDLLFLANADISAIINLCTSKENQPEPTEYVDVFDFILPAQELMDSELQKTDMRLAAIVGAVRDLRKSNRSVLISCEDGKNQCMLVAGYYQIAELRMGADAVIESLEMLYFNEAMKADELRERTLLKTNPGALQTQLIGRSAAEIAQIEESISSRRDRKCLTMASFRKILRMKGLGKSPSSR